jgi:hypothetical protein
MLIAMWTVLALVGVAAVLATVVAVRVREHRPVAVAMWATLGAEFGRIALVEWVIPPPQPEPFVGVVLRLALFADAALFLVWPASVAAVALRVLGGRSRWSTVLVIVVWAACSVAIGAAYPWSRGDVLRRCYLSAELAAAFVSLLCLAHITRRRWRAKEKEPTTLTQQCAAYMVAGQFVLILVGPHVFGFWGGAWAIALAFNLGLFAALVALHGVWLWKRPTP